MTDQIIVEKDAASRVGTITLNRPEKRNAIGQELLEGYLDALEELRQDPAILVVVTKANGPVFCAGMDLKYLREFNETYNPVFDWGRVDWPFRMMSTIIDYPKVTIAAVRGFALGAGLSTAIGHDVVVAADDAQLGLPEVLRGSFGKGVTAHLMKQGLPLKKAIMLQLLGRNVTGEEAERIGLVTFSVPSDEVDEFALATAREVGVRHPATLAHAKISAHLGQELPLNLSIYTDDLLASRMKRSVDPLGEVEGYLASQRGGTNRSYQRTDATADLVTGA